MTAQAQETSPDAIEDVSTLETLAPDANALSRNPVQDLRGMRVARPGALAFASFDVDASLTISQDEIRSGAARAFQTADKNKDGVLSIFEQQDWAAAVGAHDGPLANSMTFDANLDRSVSVDEFAAGLLRLASAYTAPETDTLNLSDLLVAPRNGRDQGTRQSRDERRRALPPS